MAPFAAAQTPDAGPDRSVPQGSALVLSGQVFGRSPIDWWTADGNGATENMLIHHHSVNGTSASGPLRTAQGQTFGYVSDLVRAGGAVWGIETTARFVFTVDLASGICTPVGGALPSQWQNVSSLAYDAAGDRLFAVDQYRKQLLRIDRTSGAATQVGGGGLAGWYVIRALAFDPASQLLFAVDQYSDTLLAIDPDTAQATPILALQQDPGSEVDELEFHAGSLYAMTSFASGGSYVSALVQRIDLASGALADVGALVPQVSGHALLVNSLPEEFEWRSPSGGVTFSDPRALDSTVTFAAPGAYVLELVLDTVAGPLTDSCLVTVTSGDCNQNGVADATDIQDQTSKDLNGNGLPDECECHPSPSTYCTAKTNSQGGAAWMSYSGSPSVSADDLLVTVAGALPGRMAMLFYGSGANAQPFHGGTLCAQPPLSRFPPAQLDPTGYLRTRVSVPSSAIGTTRFYQVWYRDSQHPDGTGVALANGLSVTFCR